MTLSNEIDTKLRLIEATVAFDDEIEQRWSADLDEAADRDDTADPDTPLRYFHRQLRRIRQGKPVESLVLRL